MRRDREPSRATIRPAEARDIPRLTEIYNHYVIETPTTFDTEPFTVEQRGEWFSHYDTSGRHRLLVAERGGEVIGYTSTSRFHPRAAYDTTVETTILCAPDAVGQGIGSLLYAALFEAIREEDVHLVMALITLPNEASCRIHEKFGYRLATVLPEAGRKFGRYWDVAYYMKRFAAEDANGERPQWESGVSAPANGNVPGGYKVLEHRPVP